MCTLALRTCLTGPSSVVRGYVLGFQLLFYHTSHPNTLFLKSLWVVTPQMRDMKARKGSSTDFKKTSYLFPLPNDSSDEPVVFVFALEFLVCFVFIFWCPRWPRLSPSSPHVLIKSVTQHQQFAVPTVPYPPTACGGCPSHRPFPRMVQRGPHRRSLWVAARGRCPQRFQCLW